MRCMAVDEDGAFFGTPVESCGFHLSNRCTVTRRCKKDKQETVWDNSCVPGSGNNRVLLTNFVGSVVHIQEEVYQDRQEVEVQAYY